MTPASALLVRHLASLGWLASVHVMDGYVECHAVWAANPDEPYKLARVEGDDESAEAQCVALLCEMCGVDVEDG